MNNICSLDDYGLLCVSGKDALSFLQGYTTCDLEKLDPTAAQIGAICNIKGRMLTSFVVVKDGESLLLRMHKPLVAQTIAFLKKYIVFSKAEMQDISENYYFYGHFCTLHEAARILENIYPVGMRADA